MSSLGVVVFRNTPLGRAHVLQESSNNVANISNNDAKPGKREIIIVRKKPKALSPSTVSVTSLVRASEVTAPVPVKKPRIREDVAEEQARNPTPLAVARRNARERNRVRQVNDGFAALRRHIPEEVACVFETANSNRGPNKKLSKVETLRMAVEYIRNLEGLLNISGGSEKENGRPSMESFPSPASSSPRDNSQERSYFLMNSPMLDDEDMDEDELDSSYPHIPQQQYIAVPESFQLVSTPHLYEEEETGQPLTPSSDFQDVANLMDANFQFPNAAEQFSVIPEQVYCGESDLPINECDFEVKYAESLRSEVGNGFSGDVVLSVDHINTGISIPQEDFKNNVYLENQYSEIELKKELPDIHVTPEDREQFEETLKWWQEKTRLARPLANKNI